MEELREGGGECDITDTDLVASVWVRGVTSESRSTVFSVLIQS